ncbi:hypothetical protein [Glycomyces sp. YM15]|uniref:hypothetical protein n=1 Tax=Glycomyces sp. YM15 TaxID=2800446 RepID=UPI0019632652|nr:hypothetical protein [Glycomyces sp. YM15]
MTDASFTVLQDATTALERDWPNAESLPALSTYMKSDVRWDRSTGTLIILNDMSNERNQAPDRDPDIYLTALPGKEWMTESDFTDLLPDRAEQWGTDPEEIATLRAALSELADVHAASLHTTIGDTNSKRAVAFDLCRREYDLRAQLAVTRMLRSQVLREMVAEGPVRADVDVVELVRQYPVESFEELATLIGEHRRLMGEVN